MSLARRSGSTSLRSHGSDGTWGYELWREETSEFAADLELEAEPRDFVGCTLHPRTP